MRRYEVASGGDVLDMATAEDGPWVMYEDAAATVDRLRTALQAARGALADIGTSADMTLAMARKKAKRIYMATDADA